MGQYSIEKNGKTMLRTRFSHCYSPWSQSFVHASDCFVQRNPAVIFIMCSAIFTLQTPFLVCLQFMLEQMPISFLEMYGQSSFLAHDSESFAVWCMYLGPWITSIWFSFDVSKFKSKLINEENS